MRSDLFRTTTDGVVSASLVTRSAADLAVLQGILENAPSYFLAVDGAPARPNAAQRLRDTRPEGLAPEDKLTVTFGRDGSAIGAADVLVGFPDRETAFLGLLVIDERRQGRGNGRRCFDLLERELRAGRPVLRKLRLAVVDGQVGAIAFWRRMGFEATGETSVHRDGDEETMVVLYEKPLEAEAPPLPGDRGDGAEG